MTSGTSAASCPAAPVEAGLRDRVNRLAGFHHPSVSHVHSVDRVNAGATLAIISESAPGVRLSDLLAVAEKASIALDISTALCVIRQYLPALAALYEHDREIAHGALAPERLVISPRAQLTVVDHAMGASLGQLRYSHQRYWKDLRVALPRSAWLPIFDHRVDVLQVGVVALSLILGRGLHDDEYPTKVPELVGSAWANSAAGDLQPLPSSLRSWLSRALQIELRTAFTSVAEAAAEFEHMLSTIGYAAEPVHLERFLARCQEKTGSMASAPAPSPSMVRPEKPAEPVVAAPRLVPPPPRAEPVVRAEAPRVERTGAAGSRRYRGSSHMTRRPRVETARVEAARPRVELRRAGIHAPVLNRPRVSSSRRRSCSDEFEARIRSERPSRPSAEDGEVRHVTLRSHAPNGFFRWFPFHSRSGGDARYAVAQIA